MIGYIDADNTASIALHEKFGFSRVGRYGRWADSGSWPKTILNVLNEV
jgi:phosphinothricin acetyltransferase